MNAIDTTITISDWLSDSYLRSVVITCFLTGFTLGALFSRHAFEFLRWCIEWKHRARQELNAEKRRADEQSRYFDGLYFDECGNPCCPACHTPLASCGTASVRYGNRYFGTCVKCGKLIHSNSNADVVMRYMRKLKSR